MICNMDNVLAPKDEEFVEEFLAYTRPLLTAEKSRGNVNLPEEALAGAPEEDFDDVFVIMRRIQIIDEGIKAGKVKLIFEELEKQGQTKHLFEPAEREDAVDFFEVWLGTLIARDRSRLNDLKLLELEKKGDLRTAKLITDETELMLRALRLEEMRKHPKVRQFIQREVAKMDPRFLLRLGEVLKRPGLKFAEVGSIQQQFLLACWARPFNNDTGRTVPPLCCFSDPALARYFEVIFKEPPIAPDRIRKMWERLGLRKTRKIDVSQFEMKGNKTIFIWTPK